MIKDRVIRLIRAIMIKIICVKIHKNTSFLIIFSTSTLRVPTSFRLPAELLEELKECAKATNRSLNNYVESILMDFMSKNKTMDENAITPDLQAKLDKAREEIHSGQCITLKSHDDIDNYFASL